MSKKILISTTTNEQYVVNKIDNEAGYDVYIPSAKALASSIFNKNIGYLVSDDNVVIMANQVVSIWEEAAVYE